MMANQSRGQRCYPLSRNQLRDLWSLDNKCASLYFNVPRRDCRTFEPQSCSLSGGVSAAEFEIMQDFVKNLWLKMSTVTEIFMDKERPELGYRLRVKKDLPCPLVLKEIDNVVVGWTADAPQDGPCAHLYKRSPVEVDGYMGGPASYMNWSAVSKVKIRKSYKGPGGFAVSIFTPSFKIVAGTELTWDYNHKFLPEFGEWVLNECCFTVASTPCPRKTLTTEQQAHLGSQYCVLCGHKFVVTNNKQCRIQMKPHFIDSHADFFGIEINESEEGNTTVIDGLKVLIGAETLNRLLRKLKELHWNVYPACLLLSKGEMAVDSAEGEVIAMGLFRERCQLLRRTGTVVLRGTTLATEFGHLQRLECTTWKSLQWKPNSQPPRGHYGIPKDLKDQLESEIDKSVTLYLTQIIGVVTQQEERDI